MSIVTVLLIIMGVYAAVYLVILAKDTFAHRESWDRSHLIYNIVISFIANFFDTLGIGSYAIATSAWKFKNSISDDLLPGTLNAAFCIPMCVEGALYMKKVDVDPTTLILMIIASMLGSVVGAKIISRLDIVKIRTIMGCALIIVAIMTFCKINAWGPFGMIGTARGLTGGKLAAGVIANFVFGGLMPAGIGLYAPCMATVLILGMGVDVAYPIMMGSSAYLCLSCGLTFIKAGKYQRMATLPMIISGSIGVLIAGSIVTNLPITVLTYMVCVVMIICSVMFLRDAKKQKESDAALAAQTEDSESSINEITEVG